MSPEIAVALIAQAGAIVIVLLSQGRKINRIETNSAVTREQTENDHSTSDFPNLRDELTATRGLIHGLVRRFDGLETWVKDLAEGTDRLDDSISRKDQIALRRFRDFKEEREDRLTRLVEHDLPRIIDRRLAESLRPHQEQ